jgi:HlyD family secretion protein
MTPLLKRLLIIGVLAAMTVVTAVAWAIRTPSGPGAGFVQGNGRIEATEIDIATKLPGRVESILVREGDFVQVGQRLAQMQSTALEAQRDEARAQAQHAVHAVASATALVAMRVGDEAIAKAAVGQRASDLDAAQRRLARTETLSRDGLMPVQGLDDDRAKVNGAEAAMAGAKAQVEAAQAAIAVAHYEVVGAGSNVTASEATVARVEADITDCTLLSPRAGRVQYLIAQSGEVLAAGGKVLNLVDLGDVYMTFFLPETVVGRLALGGEVRIVLDAAPQRVIPATISFVASTAQFTPKTVETASERQKLMFRVKAQIGRNLLLKHAALVKTGLPGVAWIKLDPAATWPDNLRIQVPE